MNKQFRPENAAMVLIDYQVGTLQLVKNMPSKDALKNGVVLAKAAKIFGMPIVMTTSVEDQVQGPIPQEMRDAAPEAYAARIKRAGIVNAWADPNFKAAVEATGRKQLVMAGITTDICLVYPSISAVHDGFDVQAVIDASGSPFEISEEMTRRRMMNEGVVLTATNTLLAELAQDWSTPAGLQVAKIMFTDILPPISPAKS